MKQLCISLLIIASVPFAFAKEKKMDRFPAEVEDVCSDKETTADIIQCTGAQMRGVRSTIARSLVTIRSGLEKFYDEKDDRAEVKSRLAKAHSTFLAYAKARCSFDSAEMLNGSGERVIMAGCYLRQLKDYAKELKEMESYYTASH